jgi:nitrilase
MSNAIVAAIQAAPVFLDRDATVEKACGLIAKAASEGASLVVFSEAFVPGYPEWIWRVPVFEDPELSRRLHANAVRVPSAATERIAATAAEADAYVAIGVDEIDGGTLYCTVLYFAPDGTLAGRHRKLMPTGGERTIWGMGDGSTLDVVRTPFGVVGGLICWENYMPLARAAMYAKGVDIYLAPTWDNSALWVSTMQHIAREGGCYVIGVTSVLSTEQVPQDLRGEYEGEEWITRGNTTIVAPGGKIVAGPVKAREDILYQEIDLDTIAARRREVDPVGHYARPDIFRLSVDTTARVPVTFSGQTPS